jgi:hypothetical protein
MRGERGARSGGPCFTALGTSSEYKTTTKWNVWLRPGVDGGAYRRVLFPGGRVHNQSKVRVASLMCHLDAGSKVAMAKASKAEVLLDA